LLASEMLEVCAQISVLPVY